VVTNGDVRVQARGWQFTAAARELAELGRAVRMADAPPADQPALGGLMLGQRRHRTRPLRPAGARVRWPTT
jgi:hypothetical protein